MLVAGEKKAVARVRRARNVGAPAQKAVVVHIILSFEQTIKRRASSIWRMRDGDRAWGKRKSIIDNRNEAYKAVMLPCKLPSTLNSARHFDPWPQIIATTSMLSCIMRVSSSRRRRHGLARIFCIIEAFEARAYAASWRANMARRTSLRAGVKRQ